MRRVMVRYTVRPECVAENEKLVWAVYAELARTTPEGLRYATFRLDDGVTFVHIAVTDADDGPNPLTQVSAFGAFQAGIAERCVAGPQATVLEEIGSYRFVD